VNAGFSAVPHLPWGHGDGRVLWRRWTVPTLLKGTGFLFADLRRQNRNLIVVGRCWRGMLLGRWANTLTIFAGGATWGLAHRFSAVEHQTALVGFVLGLACSSRTTRLGIQGMGPKVFGRRVLPLSGGATVLAYAYGRNQSRYAGQKQPTGIIAALGAGPSLLGTMYISLSQGLYQAAMNPLSFVTIFTFGELGTVLTLGSIYMGGFRPCRQRTPPRTTHALSGRFLGGLLAGSSATSSRNFAAKNISGIGRGNSSLEYQSALGDWHGGALVFAEFFRIEPLRKKLSSSPARW